MLKKTRFAMLAVAGALFAQHALAGDVAATVNGVAIPQSRVDLQARGALSQGQPDSPELRKAIKDDLINREIMAQEAAKLGLNKSEDVVQELELAKQNILIRAFAQNYAKNHPISEDQLKTEYDNLKAKLGNKEYKASHILVATEAEAKDIIAQLGKKGKFEKLAEKSLDEGSAKNGGAMNWAAPTVYVAPFANALLELQKGQYTKTPVQSQFGWHVIRLDDVRDLKMPTFEELRPRIQQALQQQSFQKTIMDLRAKAKIE